MFPESHQKTAAYTELLPVEDEENGHSWNVPDERELNIRAAERQQQNKSTYLRAMLASLILLGLVAVPVVVHRLPQLCSGTSHLFCNGSADTLQPYPRMALFAASAIPILLKLASLDLNDFANNQPSFRRGRCLACIERILVVVGMVNAVTASGIAIWKSYQYHFSDGSMHAERDHEQHDSFVLSLSDGDWSANCTAYPSLDAAEDAVGKYLRGESLLLFLLGTLMISLGEVMKLRPGSHCLAQQIGIDLEPLLLASEDFSTGRLSRALDARQRELEALGAKLHDTVDTPLSDVVAEAQQKHLEQRQKLQELHEELLENMDALILKADLMRVTLPALLQAFGTALWVPLGLVAVQPCLFVDTEQATRVLGLHVLTACTAETMPICLGQAGLLCLLGACLWSLLIWLASWHERWTLRGMLRDAMAVAMFCFAMFFGMLAADTRDAVMAGVDDRRQALLKLLGIDPLDPIRWLLLWYLLEAFLRGSILLIPDAPSPIEQSHFRVRLVEYSLSSNKRRNEYLTHLAGRVQEPELQQRLLNLRCREDRGVLLGHRNAVDCYEALQEQSLRLQCQQQYAELGETLISLKNEVAQMDDVERHWLPSSDTDFISSRPRFVECLSHAEKVTADCKAVMASGNSIDDLMKRLSYVRVARDAMQQLVQCVSELLEESKQRYQAVEQLRVATMAQHQADIEIEVAKLKEKVLLLDAMANQSAESREESRGHLASAEDLRLQAQELVKLPVTHHARFEERLTSMKELHLKVEGLLAQETTKHDKHRDALLQLARVTVKIAQSRLRTLRLLVKQRIDIQDEVGLVSGSPIVFAEKLVEEMKEAGDLVETCEKEDIRKHMDKLQDLSQELDKTWQAERDLRDTWWRLLVEKRNQEKRNEERRNEERRQTHQSSSQGASMHM